MSLGTGIDVAYLVAAICFILALKGLSGPKTARAGNLVGAAGMALAIAMTFATPGLTNFPLIIVAMVVGAVIGLPAARLVKMTAMPQMVAAFNGVGGGAAALISLSEFARSNPGQLAVYQVVEVLFGVIVGSVSFSGSVVAFAKLQELMTGRPVTYPGQQVMNAVVGGGILGLGIAACVSPHAWLVAVVGILALLFGIAFVLPIGGADVPVLISLLNSFTGLAVAASGFVLHSYLLVVAGTLVGASGTLLTRMMSAAMGRSLPNILFSAFGSVITAGTGDGAAGDRSVHSASAEDLAVLLAYSQKVIIVPGYGLAVAQAQHVARELADLLESRGVEVSYAIHPVAGRMPGHMNVLLAEANVPYEQLKEMDEVNPEFHLADVALVVGANDVVNPAAKTSPGSPIYGMPILAVDEAKNVVFLKRSMRPGFAGIDNDLLFDPKTTLLFGDAKDSLTKLVGAVKAL
ncbi:MAG TPA: NAD(P)(+) transhydrogenase (Re/Si-specific) subunit beta [Acidimicrobiales bacterium]|nr:NAD(P)(+) transhydrogenase (Re/Si-specific) subunit beta [Acidimicrobiales bacterium]